MEGAMLDWRRRFRVSSVWGQQAVPQEVGKGIRDFLQDGEKVCFERADGTFSDVAAVNIWWDKLNLGSPFLFDL